MSDTPISNVINFPTLTVPELDEPTYAQLLTALAQEINDGRLKPSAMLVVAVTDHPTEPDQNQFPYYSTGLSNLELLGLLAILQKGLA